MIQGSMIRPRKSLLRNHLDCMVPLDWRPGQFPWLEWFRALDRGRRPREHEDRAEGTSPAAGL